jgi:hypothetical protein
MYPSNFHGNVHIANIPAAATAGDLAALLDEFGIVMGGFIRTVETDSGASRVCIISLAPDKAADKAIAALQGFEMDGHKLELIRPAAPVKPEPKPRAPRPERRAAPKPVAAAPIQAPVEPARQVVVEYKRTRTPVSPSSFGQRPSTGKTRSSGTMFIDLSKQA